MKLRARLGSGLQIRNKLSFRLLLGFVSNSFTLNLILRTAFHRDCKASVELVELCGNGGSRVGLGTPLKAHSFKALCLQKLSSRAQDYTELLRKFLNT